MDHVVPARGCDRGLVSVGRLHGGDRAAVLEVFEGMSERSRRLRYHGPKPVLRESDVERLVDVGCCGREAVAALDLVTGKVVGTARFVRDADDPRSAEVAFEVVDDCQQRGVGRKLLGELTSLARREGVERFRAAYSPLPVNWAEIVSASAATAGAPAHWAARKRCSVRVACTTAIR